MILVVFLLISCLETSDSFCSIQECEENAIQLDDVRSMLEDLNAKVVTLERKNADLEASVIQLNNEKQLLRDDIIEIQDQVGLTKLPPV